MRSSKLKCENCGYIYVAPYPADFFCIKCNCFLSNLYDVIKEKSIFSEKCIEKYDKSKFCSNE